MMKPGANLRGMLRVAGVAAVMGAAVMTGCAPAQKEGITKEYMFWPPTPAAPRVQFLTSISSSADVTAKQGQMETLIYGKDTVGDLPFQRPYGVRIDHGQIYVCDATAGNVTVLDFRKKEVRILGRSGQTNLMKPIDIAVAPDGIKYVADTGHGAVLVFDGADKYAGRVAVKGMRPVSVAVHERNLYVTDIHASLVRVFDRFNGKEMRTIGEQGDVSTKVMPHGQLGGAMGLAVDKEGNVFVNDVIGCRVQKFSPEGKWLATFGGIGRNPGQFVRPKLMAVDSAGILYVVDNAFQNVQMFNDQNKLLMFFGASGAHPGAMSMPAGVAVSDDDLELFQQYAHPAFQIQRLIVVTNNLGGKKINIYALGELKPGKTVADISAGRATMIGAFDAGVEKSTIGPEALQLEGGSTTAPGTQPATQPAGGK